MVITTVKYDSENELTVPEEWRDKITLIVECFNASNAATRLEAIPNITFKEDILRISHDQMADYPASRVFVGPKTWDRSIYRWQRGYWDIIVDLHIDDEKAEVSDLILPIKGILIGDEMQFEPSFIHVP